MYTKICNPEKDMHLCQIEKRKIKRSIKPAQFQHIGLYSSLKGKTQKLQDASFGRKAGIPSFRNPPLIKAFTDIKAYNRFTLSHLYTGRSAFWGQTFAEGNTKNSPYIFKGSALTSKIHRTIKCCRTGLFFIIFFFRFDDCFHLQRFSKNIKITNPIWWCRTSK